MTSAGHAALAAGTLPGRVIPTFRPDRYLDPGRDGFADNVHALLAATRRRRPSPGISPRWRPAASTSSHGAVSADHGVEEPYTVDLSRAEAERLFQAVLSGRADARQVRDFRGHMILQMARMSVEDGLVMTIHAGVLRNHSTATYERLRPGHRPRHPRSHGFRSRAPASAGAIRPRAGLASGAVRGRRDGVLREKSRRLPGSTRVSTSARRGGSSTPPTPSPGSGPPSPKQQASTGGRVSSTTPAPFCRSPHGTTPHVVRMPRSWPDSSSRVGCASATPSASLTTSSAPAEAGVQTMTPDATDAGAPTLSRARPAAPGADRAPRARRLPPRPSGLVHRSRDRRRRVGDRRFHRPVAATSPSSSRAQDGLYTLIERVRRRRPIRARSTSIVESHPVTTSTR